MAMPAIMSSPVAASIAGNVVSSLFGGKSDNFSRKDLYAQLNMQHGFNIQDALERPRAMVHGAKHAGIHPALLFGGSAMSPPSWSIGATGDGPRSSPFAGMGQDISRAMFAKMSADERAKELEAATARQAVADKMAAERHTAEIGHIKMQDALLASQIKRIETQSTPPAPSNTSGVQTFAYDPFKQDPAHTQKWILEPSKVTSANKDVQSLEAGPPQPGFKKFRVGGPNIGGSIELPGQGMAESLEAMGPIAAPAYVWGHNLFRSADALLYGDPQTKPQGHKGVTWQWNRYKQRWVATPERR